MSDEQPTPEITPEITPDADDLAALQATQDKIIADFGFFDAWEEKYEYLIDLGKSLPDFPKEDITPENKLKGCQSDVWFTAKQEGDALVLQATSDAAIVRGLIGLVLKVYSGHQPQTILATPPDFIDQIGLSNQLSPSRTNGLHSMIQAIRNAAVRALG